MKMKLSKDVNKAIKQLYELDYKATVSLLRRFRWTEIKNIAENNAGEEIEF